MAYRQCAALKRNGQKCRGGAKAGSLYCGPHNGHAGHDMGVGAMLEDAQRKAAARLKAENLDLQEQLDDSITVLRKFLEEAS